MDPEIHQVLNARSSYIGDVLNSHADVLSLICDLIIHVLTNRYAVRLSNYGNS